MSRIQEPVTFYRTDADALENQTRLMALGLSRADAANLQAYARRLHRLDESACNGYGSCSTDQEWERAERQNENACNRALRSAAKIANRAGFAVYHQSDPRGAALYLFKRSELAERAERLRAINPDSYIGGIDSCYSTLGHYVYTL